MTRTLTILAAIATLAVSAAPASAGTSSKPPTQTLSYTLTSTMVSSYSVKRSIVVTKATDVSSVKAKSKHGIVVTKPLDCNSTAFMDYTDDSCMTKSHAGSVKARPKPPKAMVTPSGGETLSSDWVKAASARPLRNVNNIDAIDVGVKDGTSNTVLFAERSAGLMLENTMITGYAVRAHSAGSSTVDIGSSEAARNGTVKKPPSQGATDTLSDTMVSGKKAKPKSHKGHGNKGHGGVHAQWDLTSNHAG